MQVNIYILYNNYVFSTIFEQNNFLLKILILKFILILFLLYIKNFNEFKKEMKEENKLIHKLKNF